MAHYLEANNTWPAWTDEVTYTTASPLAASLKRIIELATKALNGPASDTDLLNALTAVQGESFAAEMEFYGPEEIDEDAPF